MNPPPSLDGECGVVSRRLGVDAAGAFALISETLSLGRELWLEASGESMYPVLPSGSRVLLAPRTRVPRRGDVVLVRRGERLILHRVGTVAGGMVVTRGDACREADPPVKAERTVGLAIACDDGRGVRPISPIRRWFGLRALSRWAGVELHRVARRWVR